MAGEIPSGPGAVFHFVDMLALGFILEAISVLVRGGSWWTVIACVLAALALHCIGIKWPRIKQAIGPRMSAVFERIAFNRRYRLALMAGLVLYFGSNQLLYVYQLRSDLDTYVVPRGVADSQVETIHKVLLVGPKAGITVVSSIGDQEAWDYAKALANAIKAGGWDARQQTLDPWNASANTDDALFDGHRLAADIGLAIRYGFVGQHQNLVPSNPASESALIAAFREANITVESNGAVNDHMYPLVLSVGRRPVAIRRHPRFRYRLLQWILRWD